MNEDKKSLQPIDKSPTSIDISSISTQLVNVSEVHLNVSQEVVITTEDKIRICLSEHLKRMEKKHAWIAPLGVLITIVITLVSSTFKDFIFDAATWRAVFAITGIFSFIWLILMIKEALKSEKIEDVVSELKRGSQIKTKKG